MLPSRTPTFNSDRSMRAFLAPAESHNPEHPKLQENPADPNLGPKQAPKIQNGLMSPPPWLRARTVAPPTSLDGSEEGRTKEGIRP